MPRSAPTPRCERKPGANPASANRREPGGPIRRHAKPGCFAHCGRRADLARPPAQRPASALGLLRKARRSGAPARAAPGVRARPVAEGAPIWRAPACCVCPRSAETHDYLKLDLEGQEPIHGARLGHPAPDAPPNGGIRNRLPLELLVAIRAPVPGAQSPKYRLWIANNS